MDSCGLCHVSVIKKIFQINVKFHVCKDSYNQVRVKHLFNCKNPFVFIPLRIIDNNDNNCVVPSNHDPVF